MSRGQRSGPGDLQGGRFQVGSACRVDFTSTQKTNPGMGPEKKRTSPTLETQKGDGRGGAPPWHSELGARGLEPGRAPCWGEGARAALMV